MPKSKTIKRWFIYCEPCTYRQIITADKPEAENLVEIPTSPIPGGSPVLDPETKKAKEKPAMTQPKKFKCPQCGRGVRAIKLPDVYAKAYKEIDDQVRKKEEEAEKQKRLEDGKPYERERKRDVDYMRPDDPKFLG
jgi:hypothetical protein